MKLLKKEVDIVQREEVKAILFDMDGVLVDSLDAWSYVLNDTLRHFGLKTLPKSELVKEFGAPIESDVKKYFTGKTVKEVERVYNLKFKKRKKYVKLSPQSIDVLKNLKKLKVKIGLITNSTRFITTTILSHFQLKKYFKVIVTMDEVERRKPAPDMILKACKMLKVRPKNTILVGDTINDIIAGRRAGCITVGYKIKGNYRINELKSIISFLNRKL
ncbi:MAG: HAD family hydrolase [Nanoarchaeota archaeon]|nr:HAD family hydrolase [Nanoarchaeota archaeon]